MNKGCENKNDNEFKLSLRIPFCGVKQSSTDYFVVQKRTPRYDVGNTNR